MNNDELQQISQEEINEVIKRLHQEYDEKCLESSKKKIQFSWEESWIVLAFLQTGLLRPDININTRTARIVRKVAYKFQSHLSLNPNSSLAQAIRRLWEMIDIKALEEDRREPRD